MATTRYTVVNGVVLHEDRNGTERLYRPDTLGSTAALQDATTTRATYDYWPYGEIRSNTGSGSSRFKYVGTFGYYDDGARLYVRARQYRPVQGRWMTVDPLWPDEAAYNYAENHPIKNSDPSGLSIVIPLPVLGGLGGLFGGAVGAALAAAFAIVTAIVVMVLAYCWMCAWVNMITQTICKVGLACKGTDHCSTLLKKLFLMVLCYLAQLIVSRLCHWPWEWTHGEKLRSLRNGVRKCFLIALVKCLILPGPGVRIPPPPPWTWPIFGPLLTFGR
ncbi:MAG: RHS repeat-associated core domain-containing protein [Armatimonadetes bacterium]|nr:RHS repeat-associated core domain-containing protein [Armatimonadota bacterium]